MTGPTRDDEMAAGLVEQVPFPLPEEFKKRGAIFSHADTIDAPWAVRAGERLVQSCATHTSLCCNRIQLVFWPVMLQTAMNASSRRCCTSMWKT